MDYIGFYNRVKELAKTKKLTIEYIISQAGLKLGSYNSYRRTKNLPRADEAQIIAQTLDTTVEYLVTGNPPKRSAADDTIDEIQAAIDRLREK